MKRALLLAASCLLALVGLSLLAVAHDARSWQNDLALDDLRFRAAPGSREPWRPDTVLPAGLTRRLLGLDDDLSYRRAARLFVLSKPRGSTFADPGLSGIRAAAETQLTLLARRDRDAVRASRIQNLLGTLAIAAAEQDDSTRIDFLETASSRFERSVELDPGNEDAKYNLELTLSVLLELGATDTARKARDVPGVAGSAGLGGRGTGY